MVTAVTKRIVFFITPRYANTITRASAETVIDANSSTGRNQDHPLRPETRRSNQGRNPMILLLQDSRLDYLLPIAPRPYPLPGATLARTKQGAILAEEYGSQKACIKLLKSIRTEEPCSRIHQIFGHYILIRTTSTT